MSCTWELKARYVINARTIAGHACRHCIHWNAGNGVGERYFSQWEYLYRLSKGNLHNNNDNQTTSVALIIIPMSLRHTRIQSNINVTILMWFDDYVKTIKYRFPIYHYTIFLRGFFFVIVYRALWFKSIMHARLSSSLYSSPKKLIK